MLFFLLNNFISNSKKKKISHRIIYNRFYLLSTQINEIMYFYRFMLDPELEIRKLEK